MKKLPMLCLLVIVALGNAQQVRPPVRDKKYWEWIGQEWTFQDKEFAAFQQRIDTLSNLGLSKLPDLVKEANLARAAIKTAKDHTIATMKWAYAAFIAAGLDRNSVATTGLNAAKLSLEQEKPKASYEYARTRFLVHSDLFPGKYIPLGQRLLAKKPEDYLVKHTLVRLYLGKDIGRAKKLSHELVKEWPTKMSALALLGDVYYVADMVKPSKSDLLEAKKYYELFLKKASLSNPNMQLVEYRLKRIAQKLSGK